MFTESAEFYDLVYSFKDYRKESGEIISAITARRPGCGAVLDIGCGTAEHHRYLKHQFHMDGLDISGEFIRAARGKNPDGSYHIGDMSNFNLGRKYDAVICLFSSIGYVGSTAKLVLAIKCFHKHLRDDGLLMIEPWFTPDTWHTGRLHMLSHDRDDIKICRMNISEAEGRLSIINFHYLLGTPEKGVRHFEERHELALFTREEMTEAIVKAGFDVSYEEQGLTGRGMYYGVKRS